MLDLLQASAARHCTLEYVSAGPLPRIRVDPTQLRQVVLNLIVNASEAVEDNGRITVSGGSEVLTAAALADMTFSADATPGRFAYHRNAGHGTGYGLGDDDAHVRSVLLDEADRPRIGTGGGAGDRQEPQRRAAGAERARARHDVPDLVSAWSQRSWCTPACSCQVSGVRGQVSGQVSGVSGSRLSGSGIRISPKAAPPAASDPRRCRRRSASSSAAASPAACPRVPTAIPRREIR